MNLICDVTKYLLHAAASQNNKRGEENMIYLVDLYAGTIHIYDSVNELVESIKGDTDNYGPTCRYAVFKGKELDEELIFAKARE